MMAAFEGAEGKQFKKVVVFDGRRGADRRILFFPAQKAIFYDGRMAMAGGIFVIIFDIAEEHEDGRAVL